jgi:hypothetical protein
VDILGAGNLLWGWSCGMIDESAQSCHPAFLYLWFTVIGCDSNSYLGSGNCPCSLLELDGIGWKSMELDGNEITSAIIILNSLKMLGFNANDCLPRPLMVLLGQCSHGVSSPFAG